MKWLHLMSINICLDLDNWLLLSPSRARCTEDLQKTLLLAQELTLLISARKLQLALTQSILHLGMRIDSLSFWAFPSHKSIQSCLQKVKNFLSRPFCSANEWMSLLGTLSSIEKFVPLGRLHTRVLQFFLKSSCHRKTLPESFIFPITPKPRRTFGGGS